MYISVWWRILKVLCSNLRFKLFLWCIFQCGDVYLEVLCINLRFKLFLWCIFQCDDVYLEVLCSYLRFKLFLWCIFQCDDVYLEVQIQNITPGPVYMEHVRLDPSNLYQNEELNTLDKKQGWELTESRKIWGRLEM